jgi:hypothetical protein
MADQLDKFAEKPLEWTGSHSQVHVPNRVFLHRVELQRSLQNTRDRVQVDVALSSTERLHQHGFRPKGGGMPLSSESMPAENSSPAHPISAKRSPNARAPRRILRSDSRQDPPQALRISSRETCIQHRRLRAARICRAAAGRPKDACGRPILYPGVVLSPDRPHGRRLATS